MNNNYTIVLTTVNLFAGSAIDGKLVVSTSTIALSSGALTLGGNGGITLLMDEFRLSVGARYTGAFTPPTAPFTYTAPPQPGALLTISLESVRDGLTSHQS
ncbi:MAG: hypothetical protein FWG81_11160 [Betaproteobacteria bacterium]|nr:hypothetical protein [Betaproteobacteria bacterium]